LFCAVASLTSSRVLDNVTVLQQHPEICSLSVRGRFCLLLQ
jgi:hypothetical protein